MFETTLREAFEKAIEDVMSQRVDAVEKELDSIENGNYQKYLNQATEIFHQISDALKTISPDAARLIFKYEAAISSHSTIMSDAAYKQGFADGLNFKGMSVRSKGY